MSSPLTFVFILFMSHFRSITSQVQYCFNASECVGDLHWLGDIYGYGYKSIFGGNMSTRIYALRYVYCLGSFSCAQDSFIVGRDIRCGGSHSCANIGGESYIEAPFVSCYGSNACQNSNIISTDLVMCYGDQSCINSNITSPSVYATGAHSLYGSTVETNDIYLRGSQAGFGASIKSISNETCNINCYHNGCEMLKNNNCTITLNNNDPTITIPPIQSIDQYNNGLYDMKYDSNILTLSNEQNCNDERLQFVFDNYEERTQPIYMSQQNGGPVCCRGSGSCENAGSISLKSDSLVCSGTVSCYGTVINTSNPVFCEGLRSCERTNITGANNIYCLNLEACMYSVIKNSTIIYCSGSQACQYGTIYSHNQYTKLYLLGYNSGLSLNFYCEIGYGCEITCGGYASCSTTTLHCNDNCLVHCNADTGCPDGVYSISLSPTDYPTVTPIRRPTTSPTNATTEIRDVTSIKHVISQAGSEALITWIVICGSVFVCLLIATFLFIYKKRKYKIIEIERIKKQMMINNPMVILLSIGEYDETPTEPCKELMHCELEDLAVEQDIINLVSLFGPEHLNYNIYPKYNDLQYPQLDWKQSDIMRLLNDKAKELSENKKSYDGLIVVISSHGMQGHICTSDYKLISKLSIHRLFTINYEQSRQLPKVFIFDGCEGDDEHGGRFGSFSETVHGKQKIGTKADNENKQCDDVKMNDQVEDMQSKQQNALPTDFKLALIHAASPGFQSKLNTKFGSYLLYEFKKRVLMDLEANNGKCEKFIGEIYDEIQMDLADKGKQHITASFNDKTRFIRFSKHVQEKNVKNISNISMTEIRTD